MRAIDDIGPGNHLPIPEGEILGSVAEPGTFSALLPPSDINLATNFDAAFNTATAGPIGDVVNAISENIWAISGIGAAVGLTTGVMSYNKARKNGAGKFRAGWNFMRDGGISGGMSFAGALTGYNLVASAGVLGYNLVGKKIISKMQRNTRGQIDEIINSKKLKSNQRVNLSMPEENARMQRAVNNL